ncbi:MAG: hypothetical protein ACREDJ_01610 [Methylocella sp.]
MTGETKRLTIATPAAMSALRERLSAEHGLHPATARGARNQEVTIPEAKKSENREARREDDLFAADTMEVQDRLLIRWRQTMSSHAVGRQALERRPKSFRLNSSPANDGTR